MQKLKRFRPARKTRDSDIRTTDKEEEDEEEEGEEEEEEAEAKKTEQHRRNCS